MFRRAIPRLAAFEQLKQQKEDILTRQAQGAEAELARLHNLLEDRPQLALIIRNAIDAWRLHQPSETLPSLPECVADRIREYLKG